MPGELSNDTLSAIKDDLFQGKKIAAIKKHREATGSRLLDAKTFVESLEAELRAASPELFLARPAGQGCGSNLALLIAIVAVALVVFWWLKG